MVTYEKILSKGPEAYLPEIVNGKIRFTTDTGKLFLDSDDKRIEITDFVKGKTEEEIIETESPLPKFYLASDTNLLYYYDNNEWKTVKVDIGLATTESAGLIPALLDGDSTKYLRSDGTWADAGNTKHIEIERNDYEALSDEEKRNNKFYMVKDKIEDPTLPAHIGYYFKIDNSRLNPSVASDEPRWCFNSTDAVYIYRKYGIYDSNFSVPTGGPGWGPNTNYLITSNMPLNNCYLITTYAIHGLSARGMIFIPKYIIDNGIGCLTRNGFYSKEDFQYYYIEFWGAWDDESSYSSISTYTFTAGLGTIYPTGAYCTTDRISFCNIPYLVGYDFVTGGQTMQDSLDAYLADRSYSDFPNFYQANYLLFNGAMREYDGTLMLNDVDYTGRIDTSKYALKSELSGYASTADLAGKQDTLTAGSNITFNGSTISANNTTYDLATTSSIGLMPALNGSTAKYLRSDGTWETPAGGGGGDTNYIELTQAEYDLLTPEEKMNGTLYFITDASGGGGGGSTVIPNPIGEPAGTLNTIGIDNIIYDIPGSGSGGDGSSQTITDVLWSGSETTSAWVSPIEIENLNIDKYDVLVVQANNGQHLILINQILEGDSEGNTTIGVGGYPVPNDSTRNWAIYINRTGTTLRIFTSTGQAINVTKILGVKFCGMLAPMIYSFEEREVGVWIDDKPLYQKTFDKRSLYLADSTWSNNILGTTGIQIVNYEGYFCLGADTEPSISYSYYRSSSEYFTATIDSSYSDINVRPNMNYGAIYAGLITIWYTKDSDVAGSGSYGSLGVPMVHYDDTEKVVGTYFGKPLYEKSYENIAGTGTMVNVTLSDLSNIETIFIVPEASASTDAIPFPYVHYDTTNLIGGFFTINNGVPTLSVRRGGSMSNVGLKYLTVRYTKTTD